MKNNTKKPNGIPLDIAIGFIVLFIFLAITLLFIIGAIQDKRDRLNNENLIEEKMSTKTIIYPEVEKISRRITIAAPYFNSNLEHVDRVIYYYRGVRPRILIMENGIPKCGISGQLATKKIKDLL